MLLLSVLSVGDLKISFIYDLNSAMSLFSPVARPYVPHFIPYSSEVQFKLLKIVSQREREREGRSGVVEAYIWPRESY